MVDYKITIWQGKHDIWIHFTPALLFSILANTYRNMVEASTYGGLFQSAWSRSQLVKWGLPEFIILVVRWSVPFSIFCMINQRENRIQMRAKLDWPIQRRRWAYKLCYSGWYQLYRQRGYQKFCWENRYHVTNLGKIM